MGQSLLCLSRTKIEGTEWATHFEEYNVVDWDEHDRKIKAMLKPMAWQDRKANWLSAVDQLSPDRLALLAYSIHLHELKPNCDGYKAIREKLADTQWDELFNLLDLAETFDLKKEIHRWFVEKQVDWSTKEEKCIHKQ